MLRTIAIRNESILRGSLLKSARSRIVLRLLSTQTARRQHIFRLTKVEVCPKQASLWSTNFVRAYSSLPKHIRVTLPALSPTMNQGTIVSWQKKEGDKLNEGDLLAEIETDKATMGFETPEEGYLAKILIQAGQKDVPVGKLVCIIVDNAADVAAFKDFKDDGAAAPPPAAAAPAPAPAAPKPAAAPPALAAAPVSAPPAADDGKRAYASPMAKNLARAQKLRLQGRGSGVHGSIKSGDLAGMKAAPMAEMGAPGVITGPIGPGSYKDIPLTSMRAVIAKRLLDSKQTIPHYYVTVECSVDKLLKFRAKVNKALEKKKVKVSVNDFIIKAAATATRNVPASNSYWMGDKIREFDSVDVSVAVSTDAGLITPIVFGADRKGVVQISKEVKVLANKARENKLKPNEFQGGTITISNLGMFGVKQFCAVINPPQSIILAVGTTTKKLVLDPDSEKGFKEISVMEVTLSADHRVVDGAIAAQWLQLFSDYMKDPGNMIM